MPPLSMLIKPASGLCNLRCKYCFYCDEAENREIPSFGIMSGETAEILIRRAVGEADGSVCFAFQGGEPTIAGIGFFRRFTETVKTLNTRGLKISYSIQTNGTAENADEWAELFTANDFLVGLSFDGTRECHDLNRVGVNGEGTSRRVLAFSDTLEKHRVRFNILTVLNAATARKCAAIYSFYKKRGWKYLQFIPCLDPLGGGKTPYSLTPALWLEANKRLFDLWYADNIAELESGRELAVSVRSLDDYLRAAAGITTESCGTRGICAMQNVIEADGSVYPCDFYALDEYRVGSVVEKSFRELYESEAARSFILSSRVHPAKCRECKWHGICAGGCKRLYKDGEYIFCEVSREFYEYSYPRIMRMAANIR